MQAAQFAPALCSGKSNDLAADIASRRLNFLATRINGMENPQTIWNPASIKLQKTGNEMSKKTMNVLYKSGRKVVARGSFFLTILLASVVINSGTRAMPLSTEGYRAISYDYAAGLIGFHYEDRFLVGQKTSVEILTNAETEKVTGELYGIYITNGVINYFGEDWYISPRGNIFGSPPTLPLPKMSPLQKATIAAETLFLISVLLPALEACLPCAELLTDVAEPFYEAMLGLLADPVDPHYTTLATPATPPSITPPIIPQATPSEIAAQTDLTQTLSEASILPDAILTSLNRAQGAFEANSAYWVSLQLSNMDNYLNLLQSDINKIESDVVAVGITTNPTVPEPNSSLILATALICMGFIYKRSILLRQKINGEAAHAVTLAKQPMLHRLRSRATTEFLQLVTQ